MGTGVFYPDKNTKRLRYYFQFFNTAEMDSIFYEKFYSQMTKGTFIGMVRATPEKFQFSVKVPETITHNKRLDISTERGCIIPEEFIKKSFEFLLSRESKDSILQQFDIAMINDYFPEYEIEMKKSNKLH
jgi:uncharacterized protein YecE (DUF72 family)